MTNVERIDWSNTGPEIIVGEQNLQRFWMAQLIGYRDGSDYERLPESVRANFRFPANFPHIANEELEIAVQEDYDSHSSV